MELVLQQLITSLKTCSEQLQGQSNHSLQDALHNTDRLPDRRLNELTSQALDVLSEVRLLLEPGHMILADHFLGYMSTKALVAAVEFNIPDILADTTKSIDNLGELSGTRVDRLQQIMRTLVNNGIFSYDASSGGFSNNATSRLLLSNHWTQWRNWVELYGNEFYDMARGIPASLKKDATRCPAQINFDTDDSMFKYFTEQGWMPKFFKTLSGGAIAQSPGILEDYPWDEVADETVIDLGGGSGGLIALLLRKHTTMKGGILDLEKSIELAMATFHDTDGQFADVGMRVDTCDLIAGDFLKVVPSFAVYTMKWCLHDWPDEQAVIILRNVRRAIKRRSNSRLVVLESVLTDGHMGRLSRYGDLNMMVAVGGRERDEKQWRELAAASGWVVARVCPLRNAWPCAIEFIPDWTWAGVE